MNRRKWDLRYNPFGAYRRGSGYNYTDKKFTGQQEEGGDPLGLYDYGARFYSTVLGRFISGDPLVPQPADPQALDRYSYVRNNPLRYTDPTGLCTPDIDCASDLAGLKQWADQLRDAGYDSEGTIEIMRRVAYYADIYGQGVKATAGDPGGVRANHLTDYLGAIRGHCPSCLGLYLSTPESYPQDLVPGKVVAIGEPDPCGGPGGCLTTPGNDPSEPWRNGTSNLGKHLYNQNKIDSLHHDLNNKEIALLPWSGSQRDLLETGHLIQRFWGDPKFERLEQIVTAEPPVDYMPEAPDIPPCIGCLDVHDPRY